MLLAGVLLTLPALLPAEARNGAAAQAAAQKPEPKESKPPPKPTFLIFGTVFTESGFAVPGAQIRIGLPERRRPLWEARSDRRGEFAVRVPAGATYEVRIRARGYEAVLRQVDARSGSREDLVFRLRPAQGGKP